MMNLSLLINCCLSLWLTTATANASKVPAPAKIEVKNLPALSTLDRELAKDPLLTELKFHIDLDLLAPLGDGSTNAAEYFKDFLNGTGKRSKDVDAAEERTISFKLGSDEVKALPGNDALLLEAEPWVDSASMRFYPRIWQFSVPKLPFPNVAHLTLLGRSWVARGKMAKSQDAARNDFRRTIRLGRLLLQDDFTILQNLVGLNLIRIGASALYESGRASDDGALTTIASIVYSDAAVIRAETVRRGQTILIIHSYLGPGETMKLPDERLDALIKMSTECPDRSFRCTALVRLWMVKFLGNETQKKRAVDALTSLQKHADSMTAGFAKFLSAAPWDAKILEDM